VFGLDGGMDDVGFESLKRGFCLLRNVQRGSVSHPTPSGAERLRRAIDFTSLHFRGEETVELYLLSPYMPS